MDHNMLINFHKVIVIIRYNIHNPENITLINDLKFILKNNYSNEEMINIINKRNLLVNENIQFKKGEVFHIEKDYLNNEESEIAKEFLIYAFNKIEYFINQNMFEMAYDIVDVIHVFPELFIDYNKIKLKKYWKIYIKPFQKKWKDKMFNEVKFLFK